ncbi:MAG: PRC-barrel domain-containing protein [Candidatus Aenigmarchaeota archaeon]|nr:PRC-barrel domain-containing protein [Candidatus Aenigmarchaeota archaeon]
MPITVKDAKEMFGKDIFTLKGLYCGRVSDLEFDLSKFKVKSLVVDIAKGSILEKVVGGKKGIIIPYSMVQAIGDVILIKDITSALPEKAEEEVGE